MSKGLMFFKNVVIAFPLGHRIELEGGVCPT